MSAVAKLLATWQARKIISSPTDYQDGEGYGIDTCTEELHQAIEADSSVKTATIALDTLVAYIELQGRVRDYVRGYVPMIRLEECLAKLPVVGP
jgi:hypothetical protein